MRRADPVKIDLVRAEILAAAAGLFQKFGLDKTTMEDIAAAAGKGKSTLYYYYKRKEDVFFAVAENEMASMQAELEKGLDSARSAADKLRLFFIIQDKALRGKAKLYPMIFKETKKHIQLFHQMQRLANTRQTEIFKAILLEGIASGEFRNVRKEECTALAVTAVDLLHAMQITLMLEGKVPSTEEKISTMLNVLIRGLK